ncbi:MAG: site-2 protease family protein [Firmicutes bacterium]|nr:site-2 protease family protein [Bacillota bacterium]
MLLLGLAPQEMLIFVLAIVTAIVLHECAHGYMAKWNGDTTAKDSGRLTLNPIKHFDPFGFMMLLFAGFGFAKPVPVNPYNFRRKRLGFFLVAIAGVALNLIMAFVCALVLALLERVNGVPHFGYLLGLYDGANVAAYILAWFFYLFMLININLTIFNLLPIWPLDGHRILESATKPLNKATKFLRDFGPYILLGLIGLSLLAGMAARYVDWYPEWMDPLRFLMNYVGGGIRNVFLNFWRLLFGVKVSWAL